MRRDHFQLQEESRKPSRDQWKPQNEAMYFLCAHESTIMHALIFQTISLVLGHIQSKYLLSRSWTLAKFEIRWSTMRLQFPSFAAAIILGWPAKRPCASLYRRNIVLVLVYAYVATPLKGWHVMKWRWFVHNKNDTQQQKYEALTALNSWSLRLIDSVARDSISSNESKRATATPQLAPEAFRLPSVAIFNDMETLSIDRASVANEWFRSFS